MKVKKILLVVLISILFLGVMVPYFYFVSEMETGTIEDTVCSGINVNFRDSLKVNLISSEEIISLVEQAERVTGTKCKKVNLTKIEKMLDSRGEILKSEVYFSSPTILNIDVVQRKPVVRFENETEGYYSDGSGFLFPLLNTYNVPIVTGDIPLRLGREYMGVPEGKESEWINDILLLADYISSNEYWNKNIEQIYIENGDICLVSHVSHHKIIFGNCRNIDAKFRKLATFYKTIAPSDGWDTYNVVNLKYNEQIICKKGDI
jgi:cell division protein FtsQ